MEELRVKEIINQRGISVSQFAKMIGVTREHCYSILKGTNISQARLKAMATVLNVPVSDLFKNPSPITSEYNPFEIVFGRTEHYQHNDIITFCKLKEKWGEFSNMSTAFPVECFGNHFFTSEHLFIALRFSGYPDMQREIMEYPNSMYCKKIFVNASKYKPFHHPNWHTNYFDVEVMKYIVQLKYKQNKGFRQLLAKTKGKVLVEDTTMQNTSNSVLRWGCQDLQKKDLVKKIRSNSTKYITTIKKEAEAKTASLKKPRSTQAQKRFDDKLETQIQSIKKATNIAVDTVLANCHYTLSGENAMGKILTTLRDNDGYIDYNIEFPLFLFDKEIK